jgi:hypothetical protein
MKLVQVSKRKVDIDEQEIVNDLVINCRDTSTAYKIILENEIMRSSRLIAIAATLAVAIFSATTSYAQVTVDKNRSYFSPDQQFGFGVNNVGGHIQYALGPAFHIGLNLHLDFRKRDTLSETAYDFGPYAKFIFSGDVVKPYVEASLGIIQPNSGKFDINKTGQTVTADLPDTELRLILAFGAEHFFNQNVGIYGHVNLLDALISPSPSTIGFGLQGGVAGVEFFF